MKAPVLGNILVGMQKTRNDIQVRKLSLALASLGGVLVLFVGVGFWWGQADRGPASSSVASSDQNADGQRSLDQVAAELSKRAGEQKRSKEWQLAESGQLDQVIEIFKSLKPKGVALQQEQIRILNVLSRTAKEAEAASPSQADQLVRFASTLLTANSGPGAVPLSAAHVLSAYAVAAPRLQSKIEKTLTEFYRSEKRAGIRSGALDALAKFQSKRAVSDLKSTALGKDIAASRAAIYSLSNYLGGALEADARSVLMQVAKQNRELRPLASKLLAKAKVRSVASMVPQLLSAEASVADVEAAAYIIDQFQLTGYSQQLNRGMQRYENSPFLREKVSRALNQ